MGGHMSQPINDTLTGRAAWAGLGTPATFFTLISAMMHGSHVEARLQGPQGWTGWVTLDVVLAVLPSSLPSFPSWPCCCGPSQAVDIRCRNPRDLAERLHGQLSAGVLDLTSSRAAGP